MFAERDPAASMRPHRRRLWLASTANVLLWAMRRPDLAPPEIGGLVRISARRAKVATGSAHPRRPKFALGRARCGAAWLQPGGAGGWQRPQWHALETPPGAGRCPLAPGSQTTGPGPGGPHAWPRPRASRAARGRLPLAYYRASARTLGLAAADAPGRLAEEVESGGTPCCAPSSAAGRAGRGARVTARPADLAISRLWARGPLGRAARTRATWTSCAPARGRVRRRGWRGCVRPAKPRSQRRGTGCGAARPG